MHQIKINIFVRNLGITEQYKERTGHDFWDDLTTQIREKTGTDFSFSGGNYFRSAEFSSERSASYFREALDTILPLLLEETELNAVIASVAEDDGTEEAAPAAPAETTSPESDASAAGVMSAFKRLMGDHKPKASESVTTEEKPIDTPADASLYGRVGQLKETRDTILSRVRGQRHAVNEVIRGIFEAELFAAHNEDRKGPLATFLFAGPSGVGKTFLAKQCGNLLGRKTKIIDMTEYSDNLANGKFNGDHGQAAEVTGFVREHPDGILVFDEVEKAHINTIHLFLQILDEGRLMDHQLKKTVSFRDNIIIMTTNAGRELYDDTTVCDLSGTPRNVILEGLRSDVNPRTNEPFFPECIVTRMANGNVILFNHLEPYALMQIVRDELAQQVQLFEKSTGLKVEYSPEELSALVLYSGGGVSDARSLRGLARNILVKELQEILMQLHTDGADAVNGLKTVTIDINPQGSEDGESLFSCREKLYTAVFAKDGIFTDGEDMVFETFTDGDVFKRRVRGVTDCVIIDPLLGVADTNRFPNDVDDLDSDGIRMFAYLRDFAPEIPLYILDTDPKSALSFETLLAKGARGVLTYDPKNTDAFAASLQELAFSATINNKVYSLGRSGKVLTFNFAQYIVDNTHAVLSAEHLQLKSAPRGSDGKSIAQKGENGNVKFSDLIGNKAAIEALKEYAKMLDNPRSIALSGKKMPKGVLLYGPPGTGKTMLAKAMANECNATFIPASATSFFGSLVGETERNIRDLFKRARRYAPSIIFIDEVDAIGRKRTGGIGSTHNEDALTTFLAEMDGFVTDEKRPVFLLVATNYGIDESTERSLDAAFVRRFNDKIYIGLPDTDERYEFLVACLKKHGIHFGEDHEKILKNMAARTGGMSPADLDMMHAQFVRALGDKEATVDEYMNALDRFRFGEVNKMNPDHLRQTACHEAGHALVCKLCGTTPSFLTIVSRGNYGGFMESAGESTGTMTFNQMMDRVCRSLAGRVAEIEVYGVDAGTNTGASSDLDHARRFIQLSLKDFAMGGKIFLKDDDYAESEKLAQEQYERTVEMIRNHRDILDKLTDLLTEKKCLDSTQLAKFFAENGI